MVNPSESSPPYSGRSMNPNEGPTQTTKKNKMERKPELILRVLSCLDDNRLNIYHMTISGAGTKAFCHSVESKMEGKKVWVPSILKLGKLFIILYNRSRVFTYVLPRS